jgi:hypothetical protein
VVRILHDDSIRKPRVLQFFREYFDYDRAGSVCKDAKALVRGGGDANALLHYRAMVGMTANTDRLVELILEEDMMLLRSMRALTICSGTTSSICAWNLKPIQPILLP